MSITTMQNEFFLSTPFGGNDPFTGAKLTKSQLDNASAWATLMSSKEAGATVFETLDEARQAGGPVQRVVVTTVGDDE